MPDRIDIKTRVHIFVEGLVQGVFFRENTKSKAESLDIRGWVRNLEDGRVEAVFEGEKKAVEKMIEWTKKGPKFAVVKNIEVKWQEYKGEFGNFEVRYD